jgi:hypothetical protein
MYAAVSMSSGQVQPVSSTGSIVSGMYYTFNNASFIGPTQGPGAPPAGSYRVFNQAPASPNPSLVFGLTQSVNLNGAQLPASPINAETVPAVQFATYTPLDTVYVWLASRVTAGDIVQDPLQVGNRRAVSSRSTTVRFASPSTLSYQYVAMLGAFVLSSG